MPTVVPRFGPPGTTLRRRKTLQRICLRCQAGASCQKAVGVARRSCPAATDEGDFKLRKHSVFEKRDGLLFAPAGGWMIHAVPFLR